MRLLALVVPHLPPIDWSPSLLQEYGDASSSDDDDDDEDGDGSSPRRGRRKKGYFENIKWGNVMILLMLTMGGLAPVLIFLADNLGPAVGKVSDPEEEEPFAAQHVRELTRSSSGSVPSFSSFLSSQFHPCFSFPVSTRPPEQFMPAMNLAPAMVSLGLMSTPQKRLIEFYNKHNQTDKLEEEQMNAIIMKYAGDYDTMIKKLERKYQDYGYFIGWEKEGGIVDVQEKTYQVSNNRRWKYNT